MDRINIATNKKAFRDFEILEKFDAGIELVGCEVKSLRQAKASLIDSFARIEKGEVFLYNVHIDFYEQASYLNVGPKRVRRLLLHRGQIRKLSEKMSQRGLTLIPLVMYFNERGIAKVELGLARGKRQYDKREDIKRRELDRELRRAKARKS